MRKPKDVKVLLDQLTDNGHVLKGNYDDYYVYRKDWLFDHLEQEFDILERCRNTRTQQSFPGNVPYATKINEDLGILGQ